ncbi:MAG TPA: alpha/beta hydrolase [Acidobacteriota bacterium]|nr:alpha/beta hydrolase [Acidobacteriota bacterium]
MPFLELARRIEYEWLGPAPGEAPSVVLLHHGLGSVSSWRDFPSAVADATGAGVLVYSRFGYGRSTPSSSFPWPVDFMHRAARHELPELVAALDMKRPLLVGHSDGASIAILNAASDPVEEPSGLVLLAPHVFVEERTVQGARDARVEYETGDLRTRLARHQDDPASAFEGWNQTWLRPEFRDWNIESSVAQIGCPTTVIQGTEDEYGTLAQIDSIRAHCRAKLEIKLVSGGHAPHREHPDVVIEAIRDQLEYASV